MNTRTFKHETLDLEDAIKAFDQDQLEEQLPQIETLDDVTKSLIHEETGESLPLIDAQIHHQIDPSYQ